MEWERSYYQNRLGTYRTDWEGSLKQLSHLGQQVSNITYTSLGGSQGEISHLRRARVHSMIYRVTREGFNVRSWSSYIRGQGDKDCGLSLND